MGPATQVVSPDVVLATSAGLVACLLLGGWLLARTARRRRARLDAELARSRDEVGLLSRKVEELADEVVRARRDSDRRREYVITSLADDPDAAAALPVSAGDQLVPGPAAQPVGRVLQDQLLGVLSRQPADSAMRARAVELVVRTVSLGHGLRRAMSPDVLDRAAAEAHVARRRSRRQRRRELRQARRFVRTGSATSQQVRPAGRDQDVA